MSLIASMVLHAVLGADAFPFPLPITEPAPAEVAWDTPRALGAADRLQVSKGIFTTTSGQRVRFLGVNITGSDALPEAAQGALVAARLASYGINLVRLHHLDAPWSEPNMFMPSMTYGKATAGALDPVAVQRLNAFIAALGQNGIYVDLNLKVTREFSTADGFPSDGACKVIGYFDPKAIALQEDYATKLISAIGNPPNLAVVEVNNEDAMLANPDLLERLPAAYREQLTAAYNRHLAVAYKTTASTFEQWNRGRTPLGDNLLASLSWNLEQHGSATGVLTAATLPAAALTGQAPVQLSDLKLDGTDWHLQLQCGAFALRPHMPYTVTFRLRSAAKRGLNVTVGRSGPPWGSLGLWSWIESDTTWQSHTIRFIAGGDGTVPARLTFIVGGSPVGVELADVTLRAGDAILNSGAGRVEDGSMALPPLTNDGPGIDLARTVMGLEANYRDRMTKHIRQLGVTAPITISQVSWGGASGLAREAATDWIDNHGYWQHPNFPHRDWDVDDYRIEDRSMLTEPGAGALSTGLCRIDNKPFTVSEYYHPAPNRFLAEMLPMALSTAALQDWDGVFLFAHPTATSVNHRITGFFDSGHHPAAMALMPTMSRIYRSGAISPFSGSATLTVPRDRLAELSCRGDWMREVAEVDDGELLRRRWQLRMVDNGPLGLQVTGPSGSAQVQRRSLPAGHERLLIDTPQAVVVVGFFGGQPLSVGPVSIIATGFVAVAVESRDGQPLAQSRKLLVTAIGNANNASLRWNDDHTSATDSWKEGPPMVSTPPVTLTLQGWKKATATAIRGTGTVPVHTVTDGIQVELSPAQQTMWWLLER